MTKPISLGPFELHAIIGRGGMGEVWRGLHIAEGEPVAVKVLTRDGARRDEYLESFHNEVRAVAGLSHPNIVTPLDFGEVTAEQSAASGGALAAGSPYIVMELALRGSLRKYQEALRWPQVQTALLVVLEALGHAHAAGIIHRDLKPANILVGCRGAEPGLKLTDFGLARSSDAADRAGSQESGWGTPHYMAPEQFRGYWRDYGPWTDLYSLGIMAFELVDGTLPFSASNAMGFAKAHSMDAPRQIQPRFDLPHGFIQWIDRLLQKAPEDRFQCAADAAHSLILLGDPDNMDAADVRVIPELSSRPTPLTEVPAAYDTQVDRVETERMDDAAQTSASGLDFDAFASQWIVTGQPIQIRVPPMPSSWERRDVDLGTRQLLGAGLGLFGLRTIPLVGREHERNVLWDLLKDVRETRQLRIAIIRGAAGTGKSRLAEWIARRANETGAAKTMHAVHSGMGSPSDGISRMLATATRCLGLRRDELLERAETLLRRDPFTRDIDARAFADFLAPSGPEVALPTQNTLRISRVDQRYGLLRRYLEATSVDRPYVIVIDDAQWGPDALMFLNYLVERAETQPVPVLFILTVREESLAFRESESAMLERMQQHPRTTTLNLSPLTQVEIDRLVRDLLYLDGRLADQVEDRSGGNPLFAVQIVGDMVARGKLMFGPKGFILGDGETVEIPDDIHALWRSRVFRLVASRPESDLIALEIAAALGLEIQREEWALACDLTGIQPPMDLVGILLSEGLAERRDDGWAFSHGLLRESIQKDAEEQGRWEAVNAACVEMLFRRYPRREFPFSDRMARHLEQANELKASLPHRLAAAETRVERCEFDEATRHLRAFWGLARTLPVKLADPLRGQAHLIEAQMHLQQGHLGEAFRQAETGSIEARKNKWDTLALALALQGECMLAQMDLHRAANLFQKALDIGTAQPRVRARALLGMGRVRQAQAQFDVAATLMEKARATFVSEADHVGEGRCLNGLGDVMRQTRRYREARDFSRDAMAVFERLEHQIGVADCQNDLAELYREEGQIERGLEWNMKAIQLYESLGSDDSMTARVTLALLLRDGKRPSEALLVLSQVADHHRATRNLHSFAVVAIHAISCHALMRSWRT
ncbi:MAG: protein kinase [bacterium]